ncbi:MAG TPA: glycine cleavage system protein GcvH [Rhodospirillaceae bacterium]|nr:glycine cleavage system protein GcvH [Rhodospirillaceae bacterium]
MSETYFTRDHEWIRVEDGIGTVGITDYAQHALGDIVFVELPAPGDSLSRGGQAAVVESVKAASDVFAPVSGAVTAVNQDIVDTPGLVNHAPEGDGWFFSLRLADAGDLAGLLDRAAYDAFVKELE